MPLFTLTLLAVGVGVVLPGPVSVVLGTSGVVLSALPSYAADPGGRLQASCHAAPERWFAMGVILDTVANIPSWAGCLGPSCTRRSDRSMRSDLATAVKSRCSWPSGIRPPFAESSSHLRRSAATAWSKRNVAHAAAIQSHAVAVSRLAGAIEKHAAAVDEHGAATVAAAVETHAAALAVTK